MERVTGIAGLAAGGRVCGGESVMEGQSRELECSMACEYREGSKISMVGRGKEALKK